jgi:putative ABC transport system substrate-binding protein
MRRRQFIAGITGAVAWPLRALAQTGPDRRIGALMGSGVDTDPYFRAFQHRLEELGWAAGRNVQFVVRQAESQPDLVKAYAAELVRLKPDMLFAGNTQMAEALQQLTSTIPIVFVNVPESTVSRLVGTLARPSGNATGFVNFESSVTGKWVELLKEVSPEISVLAVILHRGNPTAPGFLRAIEEAASRFQLPVKALTVSDDAEIERGIIEVARGPNRALITAPSSLANTYVKAIVGFARQHRLPTAFPFRYFVTAGGLLSYGIDRNALYVEAAGYADRILRGARPGDLPVQQPSKFELVVNLRTAKEIGIVLPPLLLARADEVIE